MVAPFEGGRLTSDAGALLLGAAGRVVGLTRRLAACFAHARDPTLIEHGAETLVMQRVVVRIGSGPVAIQRRSNLSVSHIKSPHQRRR